VTEIPANMFIRVRQRVVRHLLELATDQQLGPDLVARVSQQEPADAVGTARDVVVRILRDLRAAGLVSTGRDRITFLAGDPPHRAPVGIDCEGPVPGPAGPVSAPDHDPAEAAANGPAMIPVRRAAASARARGV
jgi:hypothetical protein